ncbi:acyltransferase-like protein At1g54570, chloroplastic [Phalaenopsis equestris]|uniref:acyltransferase-like protein At1g54570, chloroplastic n=1 Tax=Phalaenopsis equestris TaxID=78828 RepID=UPI0009E4DC0F|nr:acyltransferase-like protein At1g54570, chloroplastic [Phalaenopsis equestris]
MAMATVPDGLSPQQTLDELSKRLIALLPRLSDLSDIIPKETLIWKLELLKSASSYVTSRLHAIKAEVLVLARSF